MATDPWGVASVAPANADPWGVAAVAPTAGLPAGIPAGVTLGQPAAHPAVNMQPSILGRAEGTASQRLFGDKPLTNSATVVGQHLEQLVTGPYHAFADAPTSVDESVIKAGQPGGALGLYRMLVKPTLENAQASRDAFRAGDVNTGAQRAMDAIPIAGPWARGMENDAKTYGALPALLGLGTDIAAPKFAGKAVPAVVRGGAQLTRLASADTPSLNLAATRLLAKGSPGELLQSALKPGVKYGAGAGDTLEKSLPDVLAANPKLQGVSGFASAADAAKEASFEPYNNLVAPYRPLKAGTAGPVRPSRIDGTPIANAQLESIPTMDAIEKPGKRTFPNEGGISTGGIVNDTADKAAQYRTGFDVPTLDAVRGDANGKLNAFYNKAGGDRAAALSNPETARVKAVGDATRGVLYPELESGASLPSGSVADMQAKYGLLSDVSDIANKREPVFSRHDPVTLSQKIVSGHGNPLSMAWNYAIQDRLGKLTNSDALVNSAIDRFQNPTETPLNARPGLLPQTGMAIGNALRKLPAPPLAVNPLFYAPKNKTNR